MSLTFDLLLDIANSFCFSGFSVKSKKIHNSKLKNNYKFIDDSDIAIIKAYLLSTKSSLNSIKLYRNHFTYILCQNNLETLQFQNIVQLYNKKYGEYNNKSIQSVIKSNIQPEELFIKIYLCDYKKIKFTEETFKSNIILNFNRIQVDTFMVLNLVNDIQYCNLIDINLKIEISFESLLKKCNNLKNKELYSKTIFSRLPRNKLLYLINLENNKINKVINWKSKDNALKKVLEITKWVCQKEYELFSEEIKKQSYLMIESTSDCELNSIIKTNIIILSLLEFE